MLYNNIISVLSAITLGASMIYYLSQNQQAISGEAVETSQSKRRDPSGDLTQENPPPTTPELSLPVTGSSAKSVHFSQQLTVREHRVDPDSGEIVTYTHVSSDLSDRSRLKSHSRDKKEKQQLSIQQQLNSFSDFYEARARAHPNEGDLQERIYFTSLALVFKQVPCIFIQNDATKLTQIASGRIKKAHSSTTKVEDYFRSMPNVVPVVINHLGAWKAMLIDRQERTCYLLDPDTQNRAPEVPIAAIQPYCHTDLHDFTIRRIAPPVPLDYESANLTSDFLKLGLETMLDDNRTKSQIETFINTVYNPYLQHGTASTSVASDQTSATTLVKEIDPQFKTVRKPTLESLLQKLADKQSNTADVANNLKEFYGASFDGQDHETLKTVINSLQETKRRSR